MLIKEFLILYNYTRKRHLVLRHMMQVFFIISCFGTWLKSYDSCRSCAILKLATAIASSLYEKLLGS
jgi:hypothetical protein